MRLIIDFALTESRQYLDEILTKMKNAVEFELVDAFEAYASKLSDEREGEEVAILDYQAMVNMAVMQMGAQLKNLLSHPHTFEITNVDKDFSLLLDEAFRQAVSSTENVKVEDFTELYVALVEKGGDVQITDTIGWKDVLDEQRLARVSKIYRDAQVAVLDICRQEIAYLGEKYGKVAQ